MRDYLWCTSRFLYSWSQTVNFCPNFPESPFLEFQTRKPPSPPKWKTSDLRWPKFTPEYPPPHPTPKWKTSDLRWPKFTPEYPPNEKLQIWDDQSLLQNTPHPTPPQNEKLQIWDDQSLLQNTLQMKNFRFEMTKVYSGIPPSPRRLVYPVQSKSHWLSQRNEFGQINLWNEVSVEPLSSLGKHAQHATEENSVLQWFSIFLSSVRILCPNKELYFFLIDIRHKITYGRVRTECFSCSITRNHAFQVDYLFLYSLSCEYLIDGVLQTNDSVNM